MRSKKQRQQEKDTSKTKTKKKMKTITFDDFKDKYIGQVGSPRREQYEYALNMEIIGILLKKARQEKNWTQEELGKKIGVQRAQISKLEAGKNSATIDTIRRVCKALKANAKISIQINNQFLVI
jgi:DNA-binding XRE family transcriptional regulator